MIDWSDALKIVKILSGPLGVLLGGGGVWAYLAARQTARGPAAIAISQADLTTALTEQTRMLLADARRDRRDLARRVGRQEKQLAEVKADVADCHERHSDCEDKLLEFRTRLDNVMLHQQPAEYTEIKRVGE